MPLLGIDTSRWADNPATLETIDWPAARANGIRFAYLKATEGLSYTDPVFALHKANTAGIVPRGAYHFWRTGYGAKAQAQHFHDVAGDDLELPPVLDLEDWYKELPVGAGLYTRVAEILHEIDLAFGRACMLYTSPNILKYYLGSYASNLVSRRLWLAQYGVTTPNPTPFARYSFWQWTETGQAALYGITEAKEADLNWYPGTQQEFDAEFGLTAIPEQPPSTEIPVTIASIVDIGTGLPVPKDMTVLASIDNVSRQFTVKQAPVVVTPPVVTPPVTTTPSDLYAVTIANWQNMNGATHPPSGGPYTQPLTRADPRQKVAADNMNAQDASGQAYIKSFNNDVAWAFICNGAGGPSKGIDGKTGKLKLLGLLYPGLSNVVRVPIIFMGKDGELWVAIESMPAPDYSKSPETHPWLFGQFYTGKNLVTVPLLGGPWFIRMAALSKI